MNFDYNKTASIPDYHARVRREDKDGKPIMGKKPKLFFILFFALFVLGLIFLAFVPAHGEGVAGFLASLFTIGGTLGMLISLLLSHPNESQNSTEEP